MLPREDCKRAERADVERPGGSLEQVLAYRNDQIVHKFLERYEMSFEEAQELFDETRKWLWLCARSIERGTPVSVTQELFLLDEMWHTFILFTKDYYDFCHDCLGRFIHHFPATREEKERRARERAAAPEAVRDREQRQRREELTLIADELGADTLFKWFVDFPRRYGAAFIERAARRPGVQLAPALIERLGQIADRYQPGAARHGARAARAPRGRGSRRAPRA